MGSITFDVPLKLNCIQQTVLNLGDGYFSMSLYLSRIVTQYFVWIYWNYFLGFSAYHQNGRSSMLQITFKCCSHSGCCNNEAGEPS
jgi:hypothetical protein